MILFTQLYLYNIYFIINKKYIKNNIIISNKETKKLENEIKILFCDANEFSCKK